MKRMKLLTAENVRDFERAKPLDREGLMPAATPAIVHWFHPQSRLEFYAFEAEAVMADGHTERLTRENWKQAEDVEFFGYCVSALGADCDELTYWRLSQLEEIGQPGQTVPMRVSMNGGPVQTYRAPMLPMEREAYWSPGDVTWGELSLMNRDARHQNAVKREELAREQQRSREVEQRGYER